MLALVGESGCGKSLTAQAIMRLLPRAVQQRRGRIDLAGTDLCTLPEGRMRRVRGRRLSMIFQEPQAALDPLSTVGNQVAEATGLRGAAARAAVLRMLEEVGISDPARRIDQYPFELSGGMCQRVMIASALISRPAVLIADEPTTALDVTIQAQILDLLRRLALERGTAIVLITHDMGVVADIADRVAVMYAGRIAETGRTDAIFAAPRHPYTSLLLAALPRLNDIPKSRLAVIEGQVPTPAQFPPGCRFASRCPAWTITAGPRCRPCGTWVPGIFPPAGMRRKCGDRRLHSPSPTLPFTTPPAAGRPFARWMACPSRWRRAKRWAWWANPAAANRRCRRPSSGCSRPRRGSIMVDGLEIAGATKAQLYQARTRMQMVFQDPVTSLNPRMTVGEAVGEPLLVRGLARGAALRDRVAALLTEVGLRPEAASRYPHQFSGGQRQRVVIARALALRPALLVCDEPVSALDVSVRAQILNLLVDLQTAHGMACLFVSHDLAIVRHVCDRVAVMYLGRLVELAPRDALYATPRHPYTRALLSAVPEPDPVTQRAKPRIPLVGEIPSPSRPPPGCRFHTRCPMVQPICRDVEPEWRQVGESHVACHFAE